MVTSVTMTKQVRLKLLSRFAAGLHYDKTRKNTQAVKALPTSIKEKRARDCHAEGLLHPN